MTSTRIAGIAGSMAGALAVLLGAFGAHALRDRLGVDALATWHTAVEYQFWHALVLLLIASFADVRARSRAASVAVFAFVLGILLFCGSLFALASGAPRLVGVITPVGGVAFIVGWCALGSLFLRSRSD